MKLEMIADLLTNQIFLTVIAGVSIFILGQILKDFILKPIQDFYITKADISHKLKFHSNILMNSGLKEVFVERATGDMRDLSCNLESFYLIIPFKSLFSALNIIPSRDKIKIAAEYLIALSNAGGRKGWELKNLEAVNKIKKSLNIEL